MKNHLISIILPIHKQSDHISSLIDQYLDALKNLPAGLEMLLVVNGQDEASYKACQDIARKNGQVKVIYSREAGWGKAVRLGISKAQGDIICYTNSARTKPKDLLLFLVYSIANPDVVLKANRQIRDSLLRAVGSLIYNLECRLLFALNSWDINGTPKVFPRKFKRFLELNRDDDLIDLEFSLICKEENYPILEIPIFSARRHSGYSTTKIPSAVKMYWGALRFKKDSAKATINALDQK